MVYLRVFAIIKGINNDYTMEYKNHKDLTFKEMVEDDRKLTVIKFPEIIIILL